MPAAAVIPAPIAYTKVVAVKKLVVGFRDRDVGPPSWSILTLFLNCLERRLVFIAWARYAAPLP